MHNTQKYTLTHTPTNIAISQTLMCMRTHIHTFVNISVGVYALENNSLYIQLTMGLIENVRIIINIVKRML